MDFAVRKTQQSPSFQLRLIILGYFFFSADIFRCICAPFFDSIVNYHVTGQVFGDLSNFVMFTRLIFYICLKNRHFYYVGEIAVAFSTLRAIPIFFLHRLTIIILYKREPFA